MSIRDLTKELSEQLFVQKKVQEELALVQEGINDIRAKLTSGMISEGQPDASNAESGDSSMSNFKTDADFIIESLARAADTGVPANLTINDEHGTTAYRVTAERVEAEKKWWECQWHWWSGFQTRETDRVSRIVCEWTGDGALFNVSGLVVSTTEPTLWDFAAAVRQATGVEMPVELTK